MSKMTKTIVALGVVAGLGVAALPLSSYAQIVTDSTNVTAQAVVGEAISVTADAADDTVKIEGVTANQDVKEGSTVLTIQTNNTSGYNVNIKDADAVTALTTDGTDTTNGIPASATLTKGSKGWGFKASTTTTGVAVSGAGQVYRAIETTPLALASRSTGASDADGDKITLTFGVVVDSSIAAGIYEDEVVITATTNS